MMRQKDDRYHTEGCYKNVNPHTCSESDFGGHGNEGFRVAARTETFDLHARMSMIGMRLLMMTRLTFRDGPRTSDRATNPIFVS